MLALLFYQQEDCADADENCISAWLFSCLTSAINIVILHDDAVML